MPTVLTVGEAAKYSGLHRDRIVGALNRRQLPATHFEGRRFVKPDDLIAWLESQGLSLMVEFAR
jgi:excisionase family DNA binding protein